MKSDLTEKQKNVLREIRRFTLTHGYSPTLRELGENLGLRSLSGVIGYIYALERKGYLLHNNQTSHTIQLVEMATSLKLPPCGLQNGFITKNISTSQLALVEKMRFMSKTYSFFFVEDDSFPPYHSGEVLLVQCYHSLPKEGSFFCWSRFKGGKSPIVLVSDPSNLPKEIRGKYYAKCIAVLNTTP